MQQITTSMMDLNKLQSPAVSSSSGHFDVCFKQTISLQTPTLFLVKNAFAVRRSALIWGASLAQRRSRKLYLNITPRKVTEKAEINPA